MEHQARLSARHLDAIDRGAFPIYHEKTAAGLAVLDHAGAEVFGATYPERTYADYDAVPRLIIDSLLFIENRELLEQSAARRNPAIEWDRLALVLRDSITKLLNPSLNLPGGSTLATQIEKYRHAPAGRTEDAVQAAPDGVGEPARLSRRGRTPAVRRQIVVDYLNSTPLSARTGFGEVNGLGDGLWAWFGTDFARANRLLSAPARNPRRCEQARVYKQVLSLLLAQRRPSYYLIAGRAGDPRADRCASAPARRGARGRPELARAALEAPLEFQPDPPQRLEPAFVELKAANAIRTTLLKRLGLQDLYQLDRWISRWRRRSICRPSGASPRCCAG